MKKIVFVFLFLFLLCLLFLPFILFLLFNSQGNGIEFDTSSFEIISKNGKLYSIYIHSDSLEDLRFIQLKEGHEAKRKISLISVDSNYVITDWRDFQVTKIFLYPNRVYRIENHSNGDCSPSIIMFMTDSLGKPAYQMTDNYWQKVKK